MDMSGGCPSPWMHLADLLPKDLTDLIIELLHLSDFIRFGSVCLQWRCLQIEFRQRFSPYPPRLLHSLPCFIPSVISHHPRSSEFEEQAAISCISPFERRSYTIKAIASPQLKPEARFLGRYGSSHGWLVLLLDNAFSLVNPISGDMIQLPVMPPFFHHVGSWTPLLLPPPYYVLFVICGFTGIIYLFRRDDPSWDVLHLSTHDHKLFGDSAVATTLTTGVLYCLSLHWDLVAVNAYPTPNIEIIVMDNTLIPQPYSGMKHFKIPFLVESNGEILLVLQFYVQFTTKVTGFRVFKADFSRRMWVEMETLGDHRMLFINVWICASASSSRTSSVKGNCIYFTPRMQMPWKVFDFDTGKITDGGAFADALSGPSARHHCMIFPTIC